MGNEKAMPIARRHVQLTSIWSLGRTAAVLALCLFTVRPVEAWGPTAHDIVNTWAIQTLPFEMRGFFEANRQFLVAHANDPDEWMKKDRYERKRHYIYMDKYGIFPFLGLPHSFRKAVEQYGIRAHQSRRRAALADRRIQPALDRGVQVAITGIR